MVHIYFNEGQAGERVYIHIHRYIYLQTKIYSRNMGATWGNTAIPCTGKRLKSDRDLSENKLQDSVGTSARD